MLHVFVMLLTCLSIAKVASCPNGWILFEGSCYLFGPEAITFSSSVVYCHSRKAYMVIVESEAENQFLKQQVISREYGQWLGMSDQTEEGVWRWVENGSTLSFTDWENGEPNNGHGDEDCGQFYRTHQWNDIPCSYKLNPICEMDFNECDSIPCQNGATCINGQNEYKCICIPGWEGIHCETETDECLSNPCQNNATCNDLLNKYTCTCAEDFTGVNCEIDMCVPHHPAGADVVFVLDSSLSQSATVFQRQKDYIKEFIISFPIGVDDFQFSVVTFSLDAIVHSYLNSYTTHETLLHVVDNITHIAGPSFTGKALEVVRKDVLSPDKGARSVYHYVIVLTNGLSSNIEDTVYQATQLKLDGAHVIAIAIGDQVAHEELINIVSDSSKVFPATNKDALNSILKSHVMATCPDCFRNTSDIVILMDASKDLDQQSNLFYKQLNALKILLKAIPISQDGVHVSYTRFGKTISEEFDFDDYSTYTEVSEQITKVSRLERIDGSANATKALNYLYQLLFSSTKGRRPNARKMAIIFSNGKFDDTDAVKEEAKQLKESGVTMVTVAIGRDANITSLLEIASDPAFVYIVGEDMYTDLTVLYSLVGALEYDVCEFD